MTIQIASIDTETDSFGQWITKTNQVLDALSNKIVTTNSDAAVGNTTLTGTLYANALYSNTSINIGRDTANTILSDTKLNIYKDGDSNTSVTSNGMIINGSVLYKSNIMQLGDSVIRTGNITSQIGTFNTKVVSGNSIMYPKYIQADAINTYSFSINELSIGDIEANVQFDRYGYKITSNPTGDLEVQATMDSTDLYIKHIHCDDIDVTGLTTVNDILINGKFMMGGATGDIKFSSNVLFYGQKNFFAKGLTSNGNVGINIGGGKDFNAVAPLHLVRGGTIASGLQGFNSKSTMIVESNENNLIEFRTPADSGKYAGMIFVDNNQGGYIVYNTPGGFSDDTKYGDRLRIGAYNGVNLEVGIQNSTDGIGIDRKIVLRAKQDAITVDTINGLRLNGLNHSDNTPHHTSIKAHPSATPLEYTLPINDGGSGQALSTNGTGGMYWRNVTHIVPETDLRINSLGVATAPGASGTIRAAQDITAFIASDSSLKTNVKNIDNALEKIQSINGVEFDWTDEYIEEQGGEDGYFIRKHDVGVIAQEIESVLPEVVATRENGIKAVKYDRIVALLIEGIKELKAEVEELKKNNCNCGCAK